MTEEAFFKKVIDFKIFISSLTIVEIDKTPDENIKRNMKDKIKDFSIPTISSETEELGRSLIKD